MSIATHRLVPTRRRARRLGLVGLVLGLLCLLLGAPAAIGQDASAPILRGIDSKEPGNVKLDYILSSDAANVGDAKVVVNGTDRPVKSSAKIDIAQEKVYVSLVIGTGPNMNKDSALTNARDALKAFVQKAPSNVAFGVFVGGDRAFSAGDFTTDKDKVVRSIERIGPTDKSAIYEAIKLGSAVFQTEDGIQPNVVIVSGDTESASLNPDKALVAARGAVFGGGATVFAVNLNQFDATPINQLVADAGGRATTVDPAGVASAIETMGNAILNQQYRTTFDSGLNPDEVANIELTVAGTEMEGEVRLPGLVRGKDRVSPKEVVSSGGLPLLNGSFGLLLVIGFALVGVTGICFALTLLFVPDDSLSSVLQPYAEGYIGDDEDGDSALGRSAIVQRAVELTEQVAASQGYLSRTENALERANLPLRAGEALFGYIVVVLIVLLLGLIIYRSLIVGIILGVLAAMLPTAVLGFLAKRRRKKFMMQLPDTLQLLSGTLRAGYSLMQGIEAVSQEVQDPMGIELRRVITEARLGRPVEEALDSSAERMDSPDFAWAVMAIRIQREVGGNLSELLLTVAETMTARERLRRDVAALTAEGRMSAIILGLLPPLLGAAMFVINPEYTTVLFKDGLGIAMLILAVISMLIGFAWMRKIINIEI